MNTSFLVANWKMNYTDQQTVAALHQIIGKSTLFPKTRLIICPSFTALASAHKLLSYTLIALGAQNLNHNAKCPYTGEINSAMVAEFCSYVVIGHSERRLLFGETSDDVNLKSIAAMHQSLHPIICLDGQSDTTRQSNNRTLNIDELAIQVREAIKNFPLNYQFLIAYEPSWAIGSGEPADPDSVNTIAAKIREIVTSVLGSDTGMSVPILYGGSVTLGNINNYCKLPELNGALVGGASLDPAELVELAVSLQ